MKQDNYFTSACRYCRFYNPEGRRGGTCSQLNVSVQAHWKSCQLASPVFDRDWETAPEIAILEKSFTLGCATPLIKFEVKNSNLKNEIDNNYQEEMIS